MEFVTISESRRKLRSPVSSHRGFYISVADWSTAAPRGFYISVANWSTERSSHAAFGGYVSRDKGFCLRPGHVRNGGMAV